MGRGFNWGAFIGGVGTGMTLGGKYKEMQKQADIEADLKDIGGAAKTTEGVGIKITDRDGNTSTAVVDPGAGGNLDASIKQYQDAGYTVERLDAPQFANRVGSRDVGVFADKGVAESGRVGYNHDRMSRVPAVSRRWTFRASIIRGKPLEG